MATAVFDTLTAAETLQDAGIEAAQAAAIAHTVSQAVNDNLATKADLTAAVAELRGDFAELRAETTATNDTLRAETTAANDGLRAEFIELRVQSTAANDKLRTDLTAAIDMLRTDLIAAIDKLRADSAVANNKLRAELYRAIVEDGGRYHPRNSSDCRLCSCNPEALFVAPLASTKQAPPGTGRRLFSWNGGRPSIWRPCISRAPDGARACPPRHRIAPGRCIRATVRTRLRSVSCPRTGPR